jgi:hypothetical protein
MLRLALLRPWGPAVWNAYYKSLYITAKPVDLDAHAASIHASLKVVGHMGAVYSMVFASKRECEDRIREVVCPVSKPPLEVWLSAATVTAPTLPYSVPLLAPCSRTPMVPKLPGAEVCMRLANVPCTCRCR